MSKGAMNNHDLPRRNAREFLGPDRSSLSIKVSYIYKVGVPALQFGAYPSIWSNNKTTA